MTEAEAAIELARLAAEIARMLLGAQVTNEERAEAVRLLEAA